MNTNNTTFSSTQYMGVAWEASPLNNRCTCATWTGRALLLLVIACLESTIGALWALCRALVFHWAVLHKMRACWKEKVEYVVKLWYILINLYFFNQIFVLFIYLTTVQKCGSYPFGIMGNIHFPLGIHHRDNFPMHSQRNILWAWGSPGCAFWRYLLQFWNICVKKRNK